MSIPPLLISSQSAAIHAVLQRAAGREPRVWVVSKRSGETLARADDLVGTAGELVATMIQGQRRNPDAERVTEVQRAYGHTPLDLDDSFIALIAPDLPRKLPLWSQRAGHSSVAASAIRQAVALARARREPITIRA